MLMRQGFTGKTKYCCSDLKDNNRFVYQEGEEDDALCQWQTMWDIIFMNPMLP